MPLPTNQSRPPFLAVTRLVFFLGLLAGPAAGQERQQLTFQDLMKVRQIESPTISSNGRWAALAAVPDRGDGE